MHVRHTAVMVTGLLSLVLAACSSASGEAATATTADQGPATVEVAATDQLAFEPEQLRVPAGMVEVQLTAGSAVEHTFVIEGVEGDSPIAAAEPGATATGAVELDAGSYTFYCSVPGHRAAGMEGTVEVT